MEIIKKWLNKNKNLKKVKILILIALGILLLTFILWELLFSKYYIFRKQEEDFQEAVEKYYAYRENLLPKKGESREITLAQLFSENRIGNLTVPKKDTLCDTNSWVRVYHNEKGEYEYYTYLKCGKYESNIDHTGPKITLNGDESIIINLGNAYQELGVKSVTDDTDGKIDTNKVEIDASKVDINKTGTYKVTYKISDSLNNQTKVIRTVIVAKNLTETVKQQTDESNYYKGEVANNHVLFSGMLFRIINVNSDGTVKLISDDITNNLRYTEDKYQDSNIDKWLKNVYLPSITNDKYLVETNYCVGKVTSTEDSTNACSETIKSKVGILSLDEYQKTVVNGISSINYKNNIHFLLANKVENKITVVSDMRSIYNTDFNNIPPIKPVITLKANMYITSGNGTKEAPYKLEDYTYGKEHDKINTRLIGEYLNYSGNIFRIIGKDKKNNIKVIMAEPFMNQTTNVPLTVNIEGIQNYKFNVKEEKNPGYIMNNELIDYINENSIITSEYSLITNVSGTTYDKFETEKVKTKLMLASTTDLFSGLNTSLSNNTKRIQLFADKTTSNTVIMQNVLTGMVYEIPTSSYTTYALKAVTHLNGNLTIKSGNGTVNSPYILK